MPKATVRSRWRSYSGATSRLSVHSNRPRTAAGGRLGQTSSASVTPPRPDSAFIVADGDFIGAVSDANRSLDRSCPSQPGLDVTIATWIGHSYCGLEQSILFRFGLAPGVKQHGPNLGFSSLAGPWGKALRVGEPGRPEPDNNPFTG